MKSRLLSNESAVVTVAGRGEKRTYRLANKDSKHRQCVKLFRKSEKYVVGVKSSLF